DPAPTRRHVDAARFHPSRLAHVVLQSPDLDAMTDFYEAVAGLRLVHATPSVRFFDCGRDGERHQLAIVAAERSGLHHFSFEVEDAAALEPERSRGDGIPVRRLGGVLKDSAYVEDPDGFLV